MEREANDASRTLTIHDSAPREEADPSGVGQHSEEESPLVLRLRGGPKSKQRVVWKEDVIDNEGCGKKKSKVCCIYHKPRRFDESSDESSDDDSGHRHRHEHNRNQDGDGNHVADTNQTSSSSAGPSTQAQSSTTTTTIEDSTSYEPNNYEFQPAHKPKPK